ncbi:MAG: ATP phosphoribosyltransferase regulatory subunit, partial [Thermaurantiacus sp.]
LRILDSKDPADRALVADAPGIGGFLTSEAQTFFDAVRRGLDASGVAFVETPTLVRGFDYYRHTAFEFVTDRLGAQGTVIGGGRYDGLIEAMGGPSTPAVGWAGGVERLMALARQPQEAPPQVAVIAETEAAESEALRVADALRCQGIAVIAPYQGNPRKRAEAAGKANAESILYVRDALRTADSLRLIDRMKDDMSRARMLRVLKCLPLPYSKLAISGESVPS